jgi:hypothetical protein
MDETIPSESVDPSIWHMTIIRFEGRGLLELDMVIVKEVSMYGKLVSQTRGSTSLNKLTINNIVVSDVDFISSDGGDTPNVRTDVSLRNSNISNINSQILLRIGSHNTVSIYNIKISSCTYATAILDASSVIYLFYFIFFFFIYF